MQYTEEHYAQMYNNLPEGLKDLVLSGRLAILVSAIGARHALTADEIADLEPAIEDVCLGLILEEDLAENIKNTIHVENRVAMRIAADASNDILKDYKGELKDARLFKIQLDEQIRKDSGGMPQTSGKNYGSTAPKNSISKDELPKDVSEHLSVKESEIKDWYSKNDVGLPIPEKSATQGGVEFEWEKVLSKPKIHTPLAGEYKEEPKVVEAPKHTIANVEGQLATLTESINKLVNSRFGPTDGGSGAPSSTLQELLKRLEKAEVENEENRRVIRELQGIKPVDQIFGGQISDLSPKVSTNSSTNEIKIPIDKERRVSIEKTGDDARKNIFSENVSGNVKVTSISKSIPITKIDTSFSSSVSKNAIDTMVEMRQNATNNKVTPIDANPTKQVLSMAELTGGDGKIKAATSENESSINTQNKIEVKSDSKNILLQDLEYLNNLEQKSPQPGVEVAQDIQKAVGEAPKTTDFKSEILPATKEERMKQLQDKIKALNKNVSSGGSTNIMNSMAGADPYRL